MSSVALPDGETASTLLLHLLTDAAAHFPDALGGVSLPQDGAAFKRTLAGTMVAFEAARQSATDPATIAAHLAGASLGALRWRPAAGGPGRPLAELAVDVEPFDISSPASDGAPSGWKPAVPLDGATFEGAQVQDVIERLEERHHVSAAMSKTLRRALARLGPSGTLSLEGHRFAVLGAGAEIAPTQALVAAGAEVLWCDVVAPPAELRAGPGRLYHAGGRADLLAAPERVGATVARFAEAGPVHLGLFAYGPGQGREWRLAAAMNAIAKALAPETLRSVGLYVSPTTPTPVAKQEAEVVATRLGRPSGTERALQFAGLLSPHRAQSPHPVADTVVPLQGVSYQAAQWLEKSIAAEALAVARPGLRISANVAPVTETRSLEHPVFRSAFRGAPMFGVASFPSAFTRTLSALAYIEDVTGPEAPGPTPRHLHGGLFSLAYSLETAIRVAAVRGAMGQAKLKV